MEDPCSFKQGRENVHEFAYLQCENHTQYNAMQMQDLLEAAAPIPISHCSSMVKAIAKEIRYVGYQQVCFRATTGITRTYCRGQYIKLFPLKLGNF